MLRQVRPQRTLRATFGQIPKTRWNSTVSDGSSAKKLKNKAPSHNYIILGAKSAKLLPRKERPKPTKIKVDPIKVDVLEEQRKQLLVFKSEADSQVVLDSINMMKPLSDVVSESRYKQIRTDLKQSYSLLQLREYVSHHNARGIRGTTKEKLCDIILEDIWNLQVSKNVNETSDVIIEKTIQLSKRDLFIILSRNGAIPRSWTKSGARIVVLAQESKIVIRSTSETFDWILASLHKTLQTIKTIRIGLEGIRKIANVEDIPLSRIQQLSNASLEMNAAKDTIYASALNRSFIDHARRLIVQSTGFKPRIKDEFIYDTGNLSDTAFYRVVDDDVMNWNERSKPWSRLQALRKRNSDSSDHQDKGRNLQVFPSQRELGVVRPGNLAQTIAQELVSQMTTGKNPELPLTFTATLGYILHETQPRKKVESLSIQMSSNHSFTTNIPSVAQKCSGLMLNTLDVAHEEETESSASAETQNTDDLWKRLLEQEEEQEVYGVGSEVKPQKSKLVDTDDDYAYLAQLKFVPAPMGMGKSDQGDANFDTLPPLEMWLELDENDHCDIDSARVVTVEEETNTHLSLPTKPADIKYTTTRASFLDHNEPSVQSFLKNSNLDFSGASPVHVPDFLTITIDGKPTNYLYQAMLYRRQVDLKYKDNILQLSTIEGGGFEGRRVEATLVLDYTEGMKEFNQSDLEHMIQNSLTFNDSLKI